MAAGLLFTTRPPSAAPGDNPFDVLDRSAHEGDEEMMEEPPGDPRDPPSQHTPNQAACHPEPTDRGPQREEEAEGGRA